MLWEFLKKINRVITGSCCIPKFYTRYSTAINIHSLGHVACRLLLGLLSWCHGMPCTLQWRHNERDGVSNHRRLDCVQTVCSGVDQRKHQRSTSLAFVRGIHRWPVNSPHKEPVTRKMFPYDHVIMNSFKRGAPVQSTSTRSSNLNPSFKMWLLSFPRREGSKYYVFHSLD